MLQVQNTWKIIKLEVSFNNGRHGIADLAPEYIFFQAFKDEPELQNKFKEWGKELGSK